MSFKFLGGPARTAGPRFFSGVWNGATTLAAFAVLAAPAAVTAFAALACLAAARADAAEWIPPRPVTAWFPSATIAPGASVTLELVLRAEGASASVEWSAASSGAFLSTVTPSSGTLVLAAGAVTRIPLTVGVPPASLGLGSVTVTVVYGNGGSLAARTTASVTAATDGRPEIWPSSPTWSGTAGTSGTAAFTVRSRIGSSETVVVTAGKSNPDPNNVGLLFPPGGSAPATLLIPGAATVPLNVTSTLPGNAWAGNSNAFQVNLTSAGGISTATAFAIVQTANPDSLPTALRPIGVLPLDQGAAGRDGPALLANRGFWLTPEGLGGIEVSRAASSDSIGLTDADGDGGDDRLVGTLRIPSFAAALSVVPGFVAASGETLDLGLLAAGRAGLMILDLRVVEDPLFGAWEDFFDSDQNGVDDRILRTIPTPGFATDVAWTTAPSGRVVAFVADADTGSIPVGSTFDPLATAAGTGAGIVAIDVTAAVDSLSGLPVTAGTWSTPGNALDAEVRGSGGAVTLAVADGASGVAVADVTLGAGIPATAAFAPRDAVPLSSAWGAPYARDIAWVSNSRETLYLAVAAAGGGLQIVRVPDSGAPSLVLAQQTSGPPCGVAAASTGVVAAAQASAGVALFQLPGRAALDLVTPGAAAPYTAPLALGSATSFPGGAPLTKAQFQNPAGGATALAFEPTSGPLPDLFVCDSSRMTVLRPGPTTITAVAWEPREAPPVLRSVRLDVYPNPVSGEAVLRARAASGAGAASGGAGALRATERIDILDVQGRVVRTLR
ncbi:MAG TPA: hypothetical protein VFU59_00310, partial [Candidatus Eisenbacteria bacterium]|nr:hypothetical protein [Candidatus Eisenbacteria bacterium]